MAAFSTNCPGCGSEEIAEVHYGLVKSPDAELQRDMDSGKIILGGCVLTPESRAWQCADCGAQFGFALQVRERRAGGLPISVEELLGSLLTKKDRDQRMRQNAQQSLEWRRDQDRALTTRTCPHCGEPCPRYRRTCRYCKRVVGRDI